MSHKSFKFKDFKKDSITASNAQNSAKALQQHNFSSKWINDAAIIKSIAKPQVLDFRKGKNISLLIDLFSNKFDSNTNTAPQEVHPDDFSINITDDFGSIVNENTGQTETSAKLQDALILNISQLIHLKKEIMRNVQNQENMNTHHASDAINTDMQQHNTTSQKIAKSGSTTHDVLTDDASLDEAENNIADAYNKDDLSKHDSSATSSANEIMHTLKALDEDLMRFEEKFADTMEAHQDASIAMVYEISKYILNSIYNYIPEEIIRTFLAKHLPKFDAFDVKIAMSDQLRDKITMILNEDDLATIEKNGKIIYKSDMEPGDCTIDSNFSIINKNKKLIFSQLDDTLAKYLGKEASSNIDCEHDN